MHFGIGVMCGEGRVYRVCGVGLDGGILGGVEWWVSAGCKMSNLVWYESWLRSLLCWFWVCIWEKRSVIFYAVE